MGVFFASFEQMGPALPGTPGYTTQTLTMRVSNKSALFEPCLARAPQSLWRDVSPCVVPNTPWHVPLFSPPSPQETFRQMVSHTYSRASSQAKNFGLVGAVFAGTECLIEGVSLCAWSQAGAWTFCVGSALALRWRSSVSRRKAESL
jgi:hypothetical protein